MTQRVKVGTFDAVGGPSALQKASDGFVAGPTDAGLYRMVRCGKHSSPSYPDWSKIRWGSGLKEEGGEIKVMHDGRWQALKKVSPRMTKEALMQRNLDLYGKYELPSTWVFNDFGHITCYFFKDKNNNRKLDKDLGETVHKEYFHTTPDDEAATALGKPVTLSQSHGCIHLKPKDIDAMMDKGYFKAGNAVVVHKYDEKVPFWISNPSGVAPFELHFFPGERKVIVVGRRPSKSRR
jgi:hypothetical protein